jgi:hypothetical protein
LEQTPQCIIYHVSSNKCSSDQQGNGDRVQTFLKQILSMLSGSESTIEGEIEAQIFEISVAFSSQRILEYAKMLKTEICVVLQYLKDFQSEEGMDNTSTPRSTLSNASSR